MSGITILCIPFLFTNANHNKHVGAVFLLYLVFLVPVLAASEKRSLVEFRRLEKSPTRRLTDGGKSPSSTEDLVTTVLGKLLDVGRERPAEGRVHMLPEDCEEDEKGFARLPGDWIAVFNLADKVGSATDTKIPQECSSVVDRMRKALVFGASAIIILTLNQRIIKELDVATLFSKPVMLVDGADNITNLLQLLASKVKLKAKFIYNISHNIMDSQKFFTTVSLWGVCGRYSGRSYHEWDGVVCLGPQDRRTEGKVDPENFWNYFYSAILVLMMLHYLRTRRGQDWEDQDYIEGHIRQLAYKALAVMKIKRYSDDGCQDTCAICLEKFFPKQKLRVLPCGHHFHTKCVDPWLVRSHTCPLCKLNVIEQLECRLDD